MDTISGFHGQFAIRDLPLKPGISGWEFGGGISSRKAPIMPGRERPPGILSGRLPFVGIHFPKPIQGLPREDITGGCGGSLPDNPPLFLQRRQAAVGGRPRHFPEPRRFAGRDAAEVPGTVEKLPRVRVQRAAFVCSGVCFGWGRVCGNGGSLHPDPFGFPPRQRQNRRLAQQAADSPEPFFRGDRFVIRQWCHTTSIP